MSEIINTLEISSFCLVPKAASNFLKDISLVENNLSYSDFFQSFLLSNTPCLIKDVSKNWKCTNNWIKNNALNVDYFKNNFESANVPVSNCGRRNYNIQEKCNMKLLDYLDYWKSYKKSPVQMDCLYLKDWHFVREYPLEDVYEVPSYFASDWLNEYYDSHLELNDDYRFVYIGPKSSWTPFHVDVFTSYSWSVNISGKKRWILVPPGKEKHFSDSFGNIKYDVDLMTLGHIETKDFSVYNVLQEEGQCLFVPSGWHHQVWNLEDTISINQNWINGCNIRFIWNSLKKNLYDIKKEISDCKDMENWTDQCQLILSSTFGIDYQFFHSFLTYIAKARITALKAPNNFSVFGGWYFGENHIKFDLKNVLLILQALEKDDDFLELFAPEDRLNHSFEFLDSLNSFLK